MLLSLNVPLRLKERTGLELWLLKGLFVRWWHFCLILSLFRTTGIHIPQAEFGTECYLLLVREVKRWMQELWSQFQWFQWRAVSQAGERCDLTGACSGGARWPGGGLVPKRVRGPRVSPGICSWRQDPGRSAMFCQPSKSAASSHKNEIRDGQGMNQNPNHAPDAVLTCGESVAVIQIGSESGDMRQNKSGIGMWTAWKS